MCPLPAPAEQLLFAEADSRVCVQPEMNAGRGDRMAVRAALLRAKRRSGYQDRI